MSGGQKQRIQLARAVYQEADIYLLDDPLSAVDAHTGAIIFKDCVRSTLLNKTVILVTYQVEFLPAVDLILLPIDREILQSGSYSELAAAGSAFADLVSAHEETMNLHGDHVGGGSSGSSGEYDVIEMKQNLDRKQSKGQVAAGENENQLVKKEERETGDTGTTPYWDYLSQANGLLYLFGAAFVVGIFLVGQLMSNWWMASNVEKPGITMVRLVGVYAVINLGSGGFVALRTVFSYAMGMTASKVLYGRLMTSVFSSPMSFFDSTLLWEDSESSIIRPSNPR
ncbi:hypothetical protein R1flu_016236 [Riccia fluitans]|uniref:ABC transmembrane type-1 domain-containing protein n=1 Tax=Riccia fluitans TaxID=41844 RepID=A0ABD1YLG8_9MARC